MKPITRVVKEFETMGEQERVVLLQTVYLAGTADTAAELGWRASLITALREANVLPCETYYP